MKTKLRKGMPVLRLKAHAAAASFVGDLMPDPGFDDAAKWQDSAVSSPTGWLVSGGTGSFPGGPGSAWELDTVASVSLPAGDYKLQGVATASTGAVVSLYTRAAVTTLLCSVYFPAGASTQAEGFTIAAGITGFTIRLEGGSGSGSVTLDSLSLTAGTYSASHTYGSNEVLNGTFTGNDATGWSLSRCTISGDALNFVNSTGFIGSATYTLPGNVTDGGLYRVEFDVTSFTAKAASGYAITLGGLQIATFVPALGHFSVIGVAGSTTEQLRFNVPNNSNFVIDNVTAVRRLT